MAFLKCTKEITEKTRKYYFESMPGKRLLLWPSGACPGSENLSELIAFYRRIKEQFGISLLLIGYSGKHYEAAIRAGWGNDEIALQGAWYNLLRSAVFPVNGGWSDFQRDNIGTIIGPQRFTPSQEIRDKMKKMGCDPSEYECQDLTRRASLNPNCTPPSLWELYNPRLKKYCLSLYDALSLALNRHLDYFSKIFANVKSKWSYSYPIGNGGPFHAIYMDEPLQMHAQDVIDDITDISSLQSMAEEAVINLHGYIVRQRDAGDVRFHSTEYDTQFWLSGYNTFLYPNFVVEDIAPHCDRVFYSGYHDIGAHEIWDWFFGTGWDQTVEWEKLVDSSTSSSAWINLESDAKHGEFSNLSRYAADTAKWGILGVFGGETLPCSGAHDFFDRLTSFMLAASEAGWVKISGVRETATRRTLYCWKPSCACNPDLPDGWSYVPPPEFASDASSGRTRSDSPEASIVLRENDGSLDEIVLDIDNPDRTDRNRDMNSVVVPERQQNSIGYYMNDVFISTRNFW